jgi:hypothetical protein
MKLLVIVLITLVCSNASAQDYAFKVLINKGRNEIKAGNDWLPIKVGSSLKSVDELKISPNGYLGLVHATGKPLEVKNPGQHKVVDLAAKVGGGSSVLNKYTDFILSSKSERTNNLTATGAVHRGTHIIKVFLPKPQQAIVFNDAISIGWEKEAKTTTYVVHFNSMFGDELDKIEVNDTTVSVNLNGPKLVNEDNILVEVASKNDPGTVSESYMLKKLSAGDKKRINTSLAQISPDVTEQTALNQLLLASFYEQNALLIDAATAYHRAVQLAPNVPYYQEAYGAFLVRNGLKTR